MVFYENKSLVNVPREAKGWMAEMVFVNFGVDSIFVGYDLKKSCVEFV